MKKVKTKFLFLFLLLVIVPAVISFALANVGYFPAINFFEGSTETTGTTVFVYPSQVKDDTLQAGSTFTIYVNVSDANDLFAWQVNMSWNPSILNLTTITFGDFLAGQPNGTSRISPNPMWRINNDTGYALFAETTLGNYSGVSGNGCLASVEFLVLDYGDTVLDIGLSAQPSTVLLDQMLQDITFTSENGYFSNRILSDIRGPENPPGSGLYPPDGQVDIWDFGFIGLAYGKSSSDPDWEDYKIADTRGPEDPPGSGLYPPDGVVDIWDFGYCGLQYGESIY